MLLRGQYCALAVPSFAVSDAFSDFKLASFSCILDNALSIKLDTYT